MSMLPLHRAIRAWPVWVRVAAMTAAVGSAYAFQLPLGDEVPGDPFLVFLLVVVACTFAFGQRVGLCAVLLSSLLSTHFFEPGMSLRVHHAADLIRVELYALLAGLCVVVVARSGRAMTAAYEATLLSAASESKKAVLLNELAHRVANNFATVASLIRRQAASVADPDAKSALDRAVEQVNVMARIHRRLSTEQGEALIDSRRFILDLCDDLGNSMAAGRAVSIECQAVSHPLALLQAVPLGLIVNELATNSLKYAFPEDRPGFVRVRFERRGDQLVLSVTDDGVGSSVTHRGSGMGQQLVTALGQQLGGQVDIRSSDRGTRVTVVFPTADKTHDEAVHGEVKLRAH